MCRENYMLGYLLNHINNIGAAGKIPKVNNALTGLVGTRMVPQNQRFRGDRGFKGFKMTEIFCENCGMLFKGRSTGGPALSGVAAWLRQSASFGIGNSAM